MINYIEKGEGLHAAIVAAGHTLYERDGTWITDDPVAVQRIIDEYRPDVPSAVTARQARLALLGAGLLAAVESKLATIPGPQGAAALIEWEYASEIQRQSPLIEALGPLLGLTSDQIDALFIAAKEL